MPPRCGPDARRRVVPLRRGCRVRRRLVVGEPLMRQTIIIVLAVFALLTGLACEPEGPSKGDPFPAPAKTTAGKPKQCDPNEVPPDKPNLDQKRYVTIYGCVEDGFQPIELFTGARDKTTGEYGEHNEPSANTKVHYVVGYDSGHKVVLDISFKPSKTGSQQGMLYISDGPANRKTLYISGSWKIKTSFNTAR